MGMPWKFTARRTPSRSTICWTATAKRSHSTSGSGPDSSRKGAAGGVLDEPHVERGDFVVGPPVALERQQRAARAVVHEPVVVEAGHHLVGQRVEQPVDDLVAGLARVDVPIEVVEHDKTGRLLRERHVDDGQAFRLPCVQTLRIKHCDRSSSCSYCTT